MRTMIRSLVVLSLVAMLAAPAFAQGRGGFGMFGGGGGLSMLIGNASVQKELKLDDQQVEKGKEVAQKAMEKMREHRDELQGLEADARRTKMLEINKEMNASALKAFGEFLKPDQITRLKQISYQVRGSTVFSDPEVASKLNITDSQKSEIQTIVEESRGKMPTREDFTDNRDAAMKKAAEVQKETLAQVTAKLNDEQQKTWKELVGAPFEIKYEPRPQ
jgi:hypothetical protein